MTDTQHGTDFLLGLYRRMVIIRKFEERVKFLFLEGVMPGTIHQCQGQEATAVGVCSALQPDDVICSTHSNAFVAGYGRFRRIALFDTLIAQHTVPELVAVVAHEVGHWRKRHVLLGLALSILHSGCMLFLLSRFLRSAGLFAAFGVDQPSTYAGLVFFGLLWAPIALVLTPLLQWLSRRHELAADRFAAISTGDPEAMVSALKKLSRDNLSTLTPHPLAVWLRYSHPPVLARIRALASLTPSPPGAEGNA